MRTSRENRLFAAPYWATAMAFAVLTIGPLAQANPAEDNAQEIFRKASEIANNVASVADRVKSLKSQISAAASARAGIELGRELPDVMAVEGIPVGDYWSRHSGKLCAEINLLRAQLDVATVACNEAEWWSKASVTPPDDPAVKDALDDALGKLDAANERVANAERWEEEALAALNKHEIAECSESWVICLDEEGELYRDHAPRELKPGDRVIAKVFVDGENWEAAQQAIALTFTLPAISDSLADHGRSPPPRAMTMHRGEGAPGKSPDKWLLRKVSTTIVGNEVGNLFYLRFSNKMLNPEKDPYPIEIDHGRHYLRVGLLIPMVFRGERIVTGAAISGSTLRTAQAVQEHVFTAALSVEFRPWGHTNGWLSPFSEYRGWRTWGDAIGFQVAKDFDFSTARGEWYLGLVFEPITGFSLSVGSAVREGQYLADGVNTLTLFQPDQTIPTTMRYMDRPYVGITLTQEVLTAIKVGFDGLSGLR